MKTINRNKIQRMIDGYGTYAMGGSGSNGGDMPAGVATQAWTMENFLSIEFFSKLFKAYGPAETEGDPDVEIVPNDVEGEISNIQAMFGFWTEQYISALGQGSGGGGGGGDLNEPLASINTAGLATHPGSAGQTIIWNGSAWVYGSVLNSGVTSVGLSAPTGFNVTGSPITTAGTLALSFASGYELPLAADTAKGVTAYGWGDHSLAGYALASNVYSKTDADAKFLTIAFFRSLFKAYTSASAEVVPNAGDTTTISSIKAMFGFWTEQYISALGQGSGGGGGITLNEPLASLNNASLGSPSGAGQAIVWNGSTWKYSSTAGISTTSLNVGGSASISGALSVAGNISSSAGGFIVSGKDDTYVLLAGGGTKLLSEIGGGGAVNSITIGNGGTNYTPDANGIVTIPSYPSTAHLVSGITVNGGTYTPSSGIVVLPAYPTKASWNYDDVYLKLSGGTLANTNRTFLTLNQTGTDPTGPYMKYAINGTDKAAIGYNNTIGFFIDVYYSNTLSSFQVDTDSLKYKNLKVWYEGNDGSGSGLDADLLDGQHGSYYATASSLSNYLKEPTSVSGNISETTSYKLFDSSSETGIGFKRNGTANFFVGSFGTYGYLCYLASGTTAGTYFNFKEEKFETAVNIEAASFIKKNGTSSQFLKADGSVDSRTYALNSSLSSYVPIASVSTYALPEPTYNSGTLAQTTSYRLYNDGNETGIGFKRSGDAKLFIGSFDTYGYICFKYGSSPKYLEFRDTKIVSPVQIEATSFVGDLTGNASTATTLQTPRTLWGNSFDGSSNIDKAIWINAGGYISGRAGLILNSSNPCDIIFKKGETSTGNYGTWAISARNGESSSSYGFTIWRGGLNQGVSSEACVFKIASNGYTILGKSIFTTSASYQLDVRGVIYSDTGVYSAGYVTALSDIRKKDVREYMKMDYNIVADAPAIKFVWKDGRCDGKLQVGSIAQYWQKVMPEAVSEMADGELSMSYGVIALLSSIATARKVRDHEQRIQELELENKMLHKHIADLQNFGRYNNGLNG